MPMDFGGFQKNHARNQVYMEFGIQTLTPSSLPTQSFTTMPEIIHLEGCYVRFTKNRGVYRLQNEDISPPEITGTLQARTLSLTVLLVVILGTGNHKQICHTEPSPEYLDLKP